MKIKREPVISIVIVNWNGLKWLNRCLSSISSQSYHRKEIIFVDNNSDDESVKYVSKTFKDVKIIKSNSNEGFARGINKGISAAHGSLILIVNTDTWIKVNFLENLYNEYISNKYDVIAPLESTYVSSSANSGSTLIDFLGHPVFFKTLDKTPFYLSGVCLLFSKQLYIDSDGLDDNFFMYSEEVDWFWRLILYKKSFGYSSTCIIHHMGAGSVGTGLKPNVFKWRNENTLNMLLKNYKLRSLILIIPIFVLVNTLEMFAFFVLNKKEFSIAYLQSYKSLWEKRHSILRARKRIQQKRLIGDAAIFKRMYKLPGKLRHIYTYIQHKRAK